MRLTSQTIALRVARYAREGRRRVAGDQRVACGPIESLPVSDRGSATTVVIPVWDTPYVEYLPRALASVRAQDPSVPIVVVDNYSAVEVSAPEEALVVRSPIRVSVGAARNLGLQHVRTERVIYLDADDELIDGALATLAAGIEADPRPAAFAMSMIEGDTERRHRFPRRIAFALARAPNLFSLATSVWSLYPTQGCAIVRVDDVRRSGGYADLSRGEDWVLAVSLAFRGPVRLDRRPARIYHRRGEPSRGELLSRPEIRRAQRCIRERIRSDPGIPSWARRLLPAITCLQLAASLVAPVYRAVRRPLSRLRARRQARNAAGSRIAIHTGRHR